jgi:hypothetical protein
VVFFQMIDNVRPMLSSVTFVPLSPIGDELFAKSAGCMGTGQAPLVQPSGQSQSQSENHFEITNLNTASASDDHHLPVFHNMITVTHPTASDLDILHVLSQHRVRMLKRIPKASRASAADKLSSLLSEVCTDSGNLQHWYRLLCFAKSCLFVPGGRGGRKANISLGTKVNKNIASYPSSDFSSIFVSSFDSTFRPSRSPLTDLAYYKSIHTYIR